MSEQAVLAEFNRCVGRWVDAQDLPASKKNTLRMLAYKASKDGWRHIWSIGKMVAYSRSVEAKKLGIMPVSRRTLERHLAEFGRLGLVARNRRTRKTDNRKTSNEYVFRFDRVFVGGKLARFDFATGEIIPLVSDASNDLQECDVSAGEQMRQNKPLSELAREPAPVADDWPDPYEDDYEDGYQAVEPEPSPFSLPRSAAKSGYKSGSLAAR